MAKRVAGSTTNWVWWYTNASEGVKFRNYFTFQIYNTSIKLSTGRTFFISNNVHNSIVPKLSADSKTKCSRNLVCATTDIFHIYRHWVVSSSAALSYWAMYHNKRNLIVRCALFSCLTHELYTSMAVTSTSGNPEPHTKSNLVRLYP